MSLLIGWDSICRICLKEGDLSPIFDGGDDISAKIMLCSSIEVCEYFFLILSDVFLKFFFVSIGEKRNEFSGTNL